VAKFKLRLKSPRAVYLDEAAARGALAQRPASLDDKVLGLFPNWRPAAPNILKSVGALVAKRFQLKEMLTEVQALESFMQQKGKLADRLREPLQAFARRVDVAVIASGD
jgi:hypothetical protein